MNDLEENTKNCKSETSQCCFDLIERIKKHEEDMLLKIEQYKQDKKQILTSQLNDLKTIEDTSKKLHDEVNAATIE